MINTARTAAPMLAAAVMLLVATSGCLDWNPSRLERDGRTEQGLDADAAGDMPGDADAGDSTADADGGDTTRDMPADSDGADTTVDMPGDSTRDADGAPGEGTPGEDTPGEGTVETSPDAADAGPDVTADGPTLDGDLGALRGSGSACATNAQCASGWCADGVCCNQPCKGSCYSCTTATNPGICVPVANGAAPPSGKQCIVGAGCGRDGQCDGAGNCRNRPAGTICQAGSCNGAQATLAKICNGVGFCIGATLSPTIQCGAYKCQGGRCRAPCVNPGFCAMGGCNTGTGQCNSTAYPLGATCNTGTQCASGECVDGVCCENACAGDCRSCAVPGLWGRCINTPLGSAARTGSCTATLCGDDGTCNGSGGCRTTPAGTPCGPPSCGGGQLRVERCDGAGNCETLLTGCGDFKCQSGLPSCYGRCNSPSQCVTNNCNATTRTCQ